MGLFWHSILVCYFTELCKHGFFFFFSLWIYCRWETSMFLSKCCTAGFFMNTFWNIAYKERVARIPLFSELTPGVVFNYGCTRLMTRSLLSLMTKKGQGHVQWSWNSGVLYCPFCIVLFWAIQPCMLLEYRKCSWLFKHLHILSVAHWKQKSARGKFCTVLLCPVRVHS